MNDNLLKTLENERRYVARELHDGVAQTTLQLGLQAGICRKLLERGNLDMLAGELAELEKHIQLTATQVREIIADMRPPQVEPEADLPVYLPQVVDTHLQRGGPPVAYRFEWSSEPPAFTPTRRLALARVIQEALLNVRKHAQAKNVSLTLTHDENDFRVIISDDGQGIDPAPAEPGSTGKGRAGLENLRARVEAIGGALTIGRGVTGQGTELTVTFSG